MPVETQKSSARYFSSVKKLLNKYHILFHKIQFLLLIKLFKIKKILLNANVQILIIISTKNLTYLFSQMLKNEINQ